MMILIEFYRSAVARQKSAKAQDEFFPRALATIRSFSETHPDWHLRIFQTPAGFRVLVMHRCFDSHERAVDEFFEALGVDPVYAVMCKNQRCFRARVSPKPWR